MKYKFKPLNLQGFFVKLFLLLAQTKSKLTFFIKNLISFTCQIYLEQKTHPTV